MILAAVNYEDKLVLLTSGQELPISKFFDAEGHEVECWEDAVVFRVDTPEVEHNGEQRALFLDFDMSSIETGETGKH